MKRKTSTAQTKVYEFGCLPPSADHEALIAEQLWLSNCYYNKLIELERERFRRITEIEGIETRVPELDAALTASVAELKLKKGTQQDTHEASALVKHFRGELKAERARVSALRRARRSDVDFIEQKHSVYSWVNSERKKIREIFRTGEFIDRNGEVHKAKLRHGQYTLAEESVQQAVSTTKGPPQFKRYTGEGLVRHQIQGDLDANEQRGLACERVFANDTRIQIDPLPSGVFDLSRHARRLGTRTKVRLRVGSNEDRSPVFVELPCIIHRQLPKSGVIKWAAIKRFKRGPDYVYRLLLTIESHEFTAIRRDMGRVVAVDLGWRPRERGELRAGYWYDDSGAHGEIAIDASIRDALDHANHIRSRRDECFIANKPAFGDTLHPLTRSFEKAHRAARTLTENAVVQGWAKQDRHLWRWEANESEKTRLRRREHYRVTAARLLHDAQALVIEGDFDIRQVAKLPLPEEGNPSDGRKQRRSRVVTAPSELRSALLAYAKSHGIQVVEVPAAYTTLTCSWCGLTENWDPKPQVLHKCSGCERTWDQDLNAARNLMASPTSEKMAAE